MCWLCRCLSHEVQSNAGVTRFCPAYRAWRGQVRVGVASSKLAVQQNLGDQRLQQVQAHLHTIEPDTDLDFSGPCSFCAYSCPVFNKVSVTTCALALKLLHVMMWARLPLLCVIVPVIVIAGSLMVASAAARHMYFLA